MCMSTVLLFFHQFCCQLRDRCSDYSACPSVDTPALCMVSLRRSKPLSGTLLL